MYFVAHRSSNCSLSACAENTEIDGDGKEIAHANFNNQIVKPGDPISITCMVRVRTSNGESEPMIAVVKGTAGKDDSLNVQQVSLADKAASAV